MVSICEWSPVFTLRNGSGLGEGTLPLVRNRHRDHSVLEEEGSAQDTFTGSVIGSPDHFFSSTAGLVAFQLLCVPVSIVAVCCSDWPVDWLTAVVVVGCSGFVVILNRHHRSTLLRFGSDWPAPLPPPLDLHRLLVSWRHWHLCARSCVVLVVGHILPTITLHLAPVLLFSWLHFLSFTFLNWVCVLRCVCVLPQKKTRIAYHCQPNQCWQPAQTPQPQPASTQCNQHSTSISFGNHC